MAPTIASLTSARGTETVVFATCDAVQIVARGFDDRRRVAGYRPLRDLVDQFTGSGGRFWVHDESARARGIDAEDLIDGAELVDASRPVQFARDGGQILT